METWCAADFQSAYFRYSTFRAKLRPIQTNRVATCAPLSSQQQQPPAPLPPTAGTTLPFFGDGYRAKEDPCRRVGEDAFTNQFLDDAADLVGCPEGVEGLGAFVKSTRDEEVARKDGFILYSAPKKTRKRICEFTAHRCHEHL